VTFPQPAGIFYAQEVKANVLFFDRKPAQVKLWTGKLWIYDLRTNLHFTLKENTLKRSDLEEFVACLSPEKSPRPKANLEGEKRERPLALVRLRRANQARQDQPRHLLAKRRGPRRLRQSAQSRNHRRRYRRGPSSRPRPVRRNRE
jgi:type I restriction-modification system DNA methylase subunit